MRSNDGFFVYTEYAPTHPTPGCLAAPLGPDVVGINCTLGTNITYGSVCEVGCSSISAPYSPATPVTLYVCGDNGTMSSVPDLVCAQSMW